jgi:preprotein translocase subunit SecG
MFILSVLTVLYGILCALIILLVLIQRGKGNMGLGNVGGNNQMLFGSSGGQDVFQKVTWMCCFLLLSGSLVLAISRGKYASSNVVYRSSSSAQHQSFPSEE